MNSETADSKLLHEILLALRAILGVLERSERREVAGETKSLRSGDAALLAALADVCRDQTSFNAAEVIEHALTNDAVRACLHAAGLTEPVALGRRLRRLEGHEVSGAKLTCCGRDEDGTIWCFRLEPDDD